MLSSELTDSMWQDLASVLCFATLCFACEDDEAKAESPMVAASEKAFSEEKLRQREPARARSETQTKLGSVPTSRERSCEAETFGPANPSSSASNPSFPRSSRPLVHSQRHEEEHGGDSKSAGKLDSEM